MNNDCLDERHGAKILEQPRGIDDASCGDDITMTCIATTNSLAKVTCFSLTSHLCNVYYVLSSFIIDDFRKNNFISCFWTARLAQLLRTLLSVHEVWGSFPGADKSDTVLPTAWHRCGVSSKLRCPGAKPRRWASPLVTRFSVIP